MEGRAASGWVDEDEKKRSVDVESVTLKGLAGDLDTAMRAGTVRRHSPVPTGFDVLDEVVGGGLRPGTLTLVGGPPAVGKTIAALQWARNVADDGHDAMVVSFEHDPADLFLRVVAMELGPEPESLEHVRKRLLGEVASDGLDDVLSVTSAPVAERLARYGERLHLVSALGRDTTVTSIDAQLDAHLSAGGRRPVLFIDYLQKLTPDGNVLSETEHVTRSVEAVKDLALRRNLPVVCIVASDLDGLRARRIRLHHLRGSSALAYECDVALMLNEKATAVSKVHLDFDSVRASSFHDWVVMTVEKNRGGPAPIHLEYRKEFNRYRFDPDGTVMTDRVADERLGVA